MQSDSSNYVASLEKGLDVIRCFGSDSRRLTVTDVAEKTGFTRATARRFLLTLTQLEYVVTDGKHFELTPKILTLGHAYLTSRSLWDASRIYLDQVTRETAESCNIGILDGDEIVYVARSAAPHRIMSVSLFIGARLPAHATSMGQAILAYRTDKELTAYLDRNELERFNENTITSSRGFRKRLREIREAGYAVVDQELELGLISLAVPLFNTYGEVMAALNISAHSGRVSRGHLVEAYLPHLQWAASQIGAVALA
jgi:IclR family pca regulon transcriptional regulator